MFEDFFPNLWFYDQSGCFTLPLSFDPPESGEDGDLDLSLPGVARVILEDLDGHDLVGAFFPALGHLEGDRGQCGDCAKEDTEESDEDKMGLNTSKAGDNNDDGGILKSVPKKAETP